MPTFVEVKRRITWIADAGGTKTQWVGVETSGDVAGAIFTTGVNAAVASDAELRRQMAEAAERLSALSQSTPARIFYYGAGCGSPAVCSRVADALSQAFGCSCVDVASDMLAVGRAVFGAGEGIACILGTGSGSARFAGGQIAQRVPSLGFILGDEGSGAALGRRLLADYFKGMMPSALAARLEAEYALREPDVIERVYRREAPAAYLASFVPFLAANRGEEWTQRTLGEEFAAFIGRNVAAYRRADLPIGISGGVAAAFAHELTEALAQQGIKENITIIRSPMEGLINYHAKEL